MITQIGANKTITVRVRDANGKLTIKLGTDGQPEKKVVQDHVERVTRNTLGHGFGPDSRRPLIVRLVATDQVEFKPYRTRRSVRANVKDLYRYILMCQANAETLRKARERKAKLADRRATRRLDAAERRFRERLCQNEK